MTTKKAAPKKAATKAPARKMSAKAIVKEVAKRIAAKRIDEKFLVVDIDGYEKQFITPKVTGLALSGLALSLLIDRLSALASSWESGSFRNQRDCAKELLGLIHE